MIQKNCSNRFNLISACCHRGQYDEQKYFNELYFLHLPLSIGIPSRGASMNGQALRLVRMMIIITSMGA